jgi:hypothetical protein
MRLSGLVNLALVTWLTSGDELARCVRGISAVRHGAIDRKRGSCRVLGMEGHMTKRGHDGEHSVCCGACITAAEKARMPWQNSYMDVFSSSTGDAIKTAHAKALKRLAKGGVA